MSTKIWHISDTHGFHGSLKIPENVDIVICSGDATNFQDKYKNEQEMRDFIAWFASLAIKHKIYVPGNHDTSVEQGLIDKNLFVDHGIELLIDQTVAVMGLTVFGSPWTPTFGHGWAWNKDRDQLHDVWEQIQEGTDIVVTHGPPKTIMDLAYGTSNKIEFAGCDSLLHYIQKIKPQLSLFGHIHADEFNPGIQLRPGLRTKFSNGSCVLDGKFSYGLSSHGNTFVI